MQILLISFLLFFGAVVLYWFKKFPLKPAVAGILAIAALATAGLSFFIYTIRYSGTIMYRAHGWPHSFARYQIKDVIDNFAMGRWLFLPGSFYAYIIADFIFYFSVLIFVYSAVNFLQKRVNFKKLVCGGGRQKRLFLL